jgi:hypothetical protein
VGEAPDAAGILMAGRLSRFLNLERRRKPDAAPPHEVVSRGRFDPRPEIELSPDHGEQPFLRCPSCEADNSRYAASCVNCGGRLDTAAVTEWNDRLWISLHEEKAAPADAMPEAEVSTAEARADERGRPLLRVAGAAMAIALAAWVKGLGGARFRD